MLKKKILLLPLLVAMFMIFNVVGGPQVQAADYGANITIYDNYATASGNAWYSSHTEDQEVEPNCVTGQSWDMEGFFLKGTKLTMVGGFDFVKGVGGERSGDIFLATRSIPVYGAEALGSGFGQQGQNVLNNVFGYDYVLAMNFDNKTYSAFVLTGASTLAVVYDQNTVANPWRYNAGGTLVDGYQNVVFDYAANLSDAAVGNGLTGGLQNVVGLDLSFLPPDQRSFFTHFTMECGNDNLMGLGLGLEGTGGQVPIPGSALLLVSGLLGLVALGTRRRSLP